MSGSSRRDYFQRASGIGRGGEGVGAALTTTYGYDYLGNRVFQQGTTTTSLYPFKNYSIASSTGTGAKYSTTTISVYGGDSLLATVDTQLQSGTATSTQTRYIHPDHLGSTNVITDENGALVQILDYYPFGSQRVNSGTSTPQRQFIGQYFDPGSSLTYLNARYYSSDRGQFLSQDPFFTGDPEEMDLENPQSLNSYSYANNNPIRLKDPDGKQAQLAIPAVKEAIQVIPILLALGQQVGPEIAAAIGKVVNQIIGYIAATLSSQVQPGVSGQVTPSITMPAQPSPIYIGPVKITPAGQSTPALPGSITPWPQGGSIDFSKSQGRPISKPTDAPPGTKSIDSVGLPKDLIHKIKEDVGAGPRDWTGVSPKGDVITGTPEGKAFNNGPVSNWQYGSGGN